MTAYRQRSVATMYIFSSLLHSVRVYALARRLQTYKHWDESIGIFFCILILLSVTYILIVLINK